MISRHFLRSELKDAGGIIERLSERVFESAVTIGSEDDDKYAENRECKEDE